MFRTKFQKLKKNSIMSIFAKNYKFSRINMRNLIDVLITHIFLNDLKARNISLNVEP